MIQLMYIVKGRPEWLTDSALGYMDIPSLLLFSCLYVKFLLLQFLDGLRFVISGSRKKVCVPYTTYCRHIKKEMYYICIHKASLGRQYEYFLPQEKSSLYIKFIYFSVLI